MSQQVKELSLNTFLLEGPKEQAQFSQDFFASLKETGFVLIKDHPISTSHLDEVYELCKVFFNQPSEVKNKYIYPHGGGLRGYTPFGVEHAKDSKVPDLKEFWHIGQTLPEDHPLYSQYPQNIWPTEQGEYFKKVFSTLYGLLENTAQILLRSLTFPLNLPVHYFDNMVQNGNSVLRLLHYPPLSKDVPKNAIRARAHEDINLITLLFGGSEAGLEILDRQGRWTPISAKSNQLIVNSGDMLQRITNKLIPATTHRVVNPPDKQNNHRYSLPFFTHPQPNTMLSCLPQCYDENNTPPENITAQMFLEERLTEIGLY